MATLLRRRRSRFDRVEVSPDGTACFEQDEEELMPRPIKSIFLDKQTYEDMGSPSVITVDITPGDLLNEEST